MGVGSFDPRFHVKEPTVRLAGDLRRDADGYQGNWIPHRLREATEGGVFFVGDSAGHCLPLTAEGIRTALYFGIACGRELREVIAGRQARAAALAGYGAFSAAHRSKFEWMLRVQRLVPRVPPRLLGTRAAGLRAQGDASTGRSAITCRSRRRSSRSPASRPAARAHALSECDGAGRRVWARDVHRPRR